MMMIHMVTSFTMYLLLFQYLLIKLKKEILVIFILPDKIADILLSWFDDNNFSKFSSSTYYLIMLCSGQYLENHLTNLIKFFVCLCLSKRYTQLLAEYNYFLLDIGTMNALYNYHL